MLSFLDTVQPENTFSNIFRYLRDESGLNRKNIVDNRVHCCFYFINPYGHGLKPLDMEVMKQLSNKVKWIECHIFVIWS